jgi:hypothetical protein
MKKPFLFFVCMLISLGLFAQVEKGKVLLGASTPISGGIASLLPNGGTGGAGIGFTTQKFDEFKTKTTSFGLSPLIGYAVADNFLVGVAFNAFSATTKDDEGEDEKITYSSLSVEPQLRYYFSSAKVAPFLEVGALVGRISSKWEYPGSSSKDKTNLSAIRGGAGVALFVSPSTSIDFMINYNAGQITDPEDEEYKSTFSTFGFNIGFSWFLR